jgi:hypothetical protein
MVAGNNSEDWSAAATGNMQATDLPESADAENNTTLQGSITILRYAPPIFFPLGVIFNIIIICVPFLKQNRLSSCFAYIGAIASADLLQVITIFGIWAQLHTSVTLSHGLCTAATYFYSVWELCGIVFILAVTIDRAILVSLPMSHFSMRTRKRALLVLITLTLLSFFYNMPFFILKPVLFDTKCSIMVGGNPMWTFEWINFTLKILLPIIVVICIDVLIAKKLHLVSCRSIFKWNMKWRPDTGTAIHRGTAGATSVSHDDISIEDRKSAIMVVVMNFICLVVLTSPRFLHYASMYLSDHASYTDFTGPYEDLSYEVTRVLYLISVSLKFIIYMLSNRQFRKDSTEVFSIAGSWIYLLYHRIRS